MSNDEKDHSPGMPFDSVFKTAAQKEGHLLVPVIENMFHVKAELVDLKEIERIANERYENRLKRISRRLSKKLSKKQTEKILAYNQAEYVKIYSELKECYGKFLNACKTGVLSEDDTRNLAELSKIILNHITRKLDSDLNERLVALLGGQIIELRQDIWFKEGAKQHDRDKIADMLRRGKTPE